MQDLKLASNFLKVSLLSLFVKNNWLSRACTLAMAVSESRLLTVLTTAFTSSFDRIVSLGIA